MPIYIYKPIPGAQDLDLNARPVKIKRTPPALLVFGSYYQSPLKQCWHIISRQSACTHSQYHKFPRIASWAKIRCIETHTNPHTGVNSRTKTVRLSSITQLQIRPVPSPDNKKQKNSYNRKLKTPTQKNKLPNLALEPQNCLEHGQGPFGCMAQYRVQIRAINRPEIKATTDMVRHGTATDLTRLAVAL